MNFKITDTILDTIEKRYNNGETLTNICNDYGYCRKHMSNLLKKRGFKFRTRKYSLNENYFENIDSPEKAYWLGFICGDGCVDQSFEFVRIKLSSVDTEHLVKLRLALRSNYSIKTKIHKTNYGNKEMSSLTICSKKLCKDLNKLGCTPNKSNTLLFPDIDDKLNLHFIRGLIDADGYISYDKSKENIKRPSVGLVGNYDVIHKVKDILKAEGISNIKIRQDKRKENVWELRIRKQSEVAKAYRKLYLGSKIYLDRKKYKLFNLLKEASTTIITPS